MPPIPQYGRRTSINPAPAQNQAARDRASISFQFGGNTRYAMFGTPEQRRQYGWGDPGRLSGGQDIVREFEQQFQPNAGIFSPSFPLVPVEPELARLWDFPVGWNYIWTPRAYEPVSFEELRALATHEALTRMAIETRKDQIEKLDWDIKPRDEKNAAKDAPGRIKTLLKFWNRPDGERQFASWLREALEDMLVIDASTFEILRNRDGSVRGYDIVDGSTIKVVIDITGRKPASPAPAFEQVIHGRPWRLFNEDELIYSPRNKRPGHVMGYSPVEQILTFINIALRRQTSQLMYFTEGNLPPGFLQVPELNATQVAELQQHVNDLMAGNLAEKRRFQMLPYAAKWQAVKDAPLKDEFDEWLARVVSFCFSLPPDPFVRMRSRATSETAKQTALEEGLAPLMAWVKRLIDYEVQERMGHQDLEFSWADIKQVDPDVQSKVETLYLKLGAKTIDEVRDVMGMDPLPGGIGSQPYVVAGNQVLMVKDIEDASSLAANPPPPPIFQPGLGPQGPGGTRPPPGRPGGGGGGSQRNGRGGAEGPGAQRQGTRSQDPATIKPPARPAAAAGERKALGPLNSSGTGNGYSGGLEKSSWPQSGLDDARRAAHDHEARQLLRLHRASRVEADLRASGA